MQKIRFIMRNYISEKMFCDLLIYLHTYSIYANFKLYIRENIEKNIAEGNTSLYKIHSCQKKMYSDFKIFC